MTQLRTRQIASITEPSTAISWYTNQRTINLSIANRGRWCDMTMDAFTLQNFIRELQDAHSEIAHSNPVPIWYKGRNIGEAVRSGSIYTFHASEELDADAQEFARRELEAMNQTWRQIL